jgi:excisionase family DNA binding protein
MQDACAYLQCTRRFLERMVRSGRLRALKPSRKLLRFRQTDLDAFLESGATMEAGR